MMMRMMMIGAHSKVEVLRYNPEGRWFEYIWSQYIFKFA
jgi:hypothetical protein